MTPIHSEQLRRAQECRDSLDRFIGHPSSQHLREQFERKRDAYLEEYDEKYDVVLLKEKQKGWLRRWMLSRIQ